MKDYVVGYCFNDDLSQVALIVKRKPAWQVGLMNGIGGKVELLEYPWEAMSREFKEEAGLLIPSDRWLHIRTERFDSEQEAERGMLTGARVFHFATSVSMREWEGIIGREEERVEKVPLVRLYDTPQNFIYNLPYLVPMAKILLRQPPANRPQP